jgi:hypothetical protein
MKVTVTREPGVNKYVIEEYTGNATRIYTFSNLEAASVSAGWMTFLIPRTALARQLRAHRKFKRERGAE